MIRPRRLVAPLVTAAIVALAVVLSGWAGYPIYHPVWSINRDYLEKIATTAEALREGTGRYPADMDELTDQARRLEIKSFLDLWKEDLPVDFYGHPFVYKASGDGFSLKSLGRDGKEGGYGHDEDQTWPPRPYTHGFRVPLLDYLESDGFPKAVQAALFSAFNTALLWIVILYRSKLPDRPARPMHLLWKLFIFLAIIGTATWFGLMILTVHTYGFH